jgi:hypothetical protein
VNKKFSTAGKIFQAALVNFPGNGLAAYHLGLINIHQDQLKKAIRNWQYYSIISPKKAKADKIHQQLTLMVQQQMEKEISIALAVERGMGVTSPEPGTVQFSHCK